MVATSETDNYNLRVIAHDRVELDTGVYLLVGNGKTKALRGISRHAFPHCTLSSKFKGRLSSTLRELMTSPCSKDGRYEWVLSEARKAFPGMLRNIEFRYDKSITIKKENGRLVSRRAVRAIIVSDKNESFSLVCAPSSLISGLRQLVAVASCTDGTVLCVDDAGSNMHPHSVRSILRSMRSECERRGILIILATNSPVLMSEFGGKDLGRILVIGDDRVAPLNEIRDPEWLAHFDPGDLYSRNEFGFLV